MFNNISWHNYLLYSLCAVGIYYCYVLIVYYRKDFKKTAQTSDPLSSTRITSPIIANSTSRTLDYLNPDSIEQLFNRALSLSENIKTVFQEVTYNEGNNEDLFYQLKKTVAGYADLAQTPFMVAINNLIITESEKYQFEIPDKKEIMTLWVRGNP